MSSTRTTIRQAEPHYIIEESSIDDRGVVVITSARLVSVGERTTGQPAETPPNDATEDDKNTTKSTGGAGRPVSPLWEPRRQHRTDPRPQRPHGPQERRPQ